MVFVLDFLDSMSFLSYGESLYTLMGFQTNNKPVKLPTDQTGVRYRPITGLASF